MDLPDSAGAVARLRALPVGTRVSIRRRLAQGFTDALGILTDTDDDGCVVETRKGAVRIEWSAVVAGKQVPPPPPRRPARGQP